MLVTRDATSLSITTFQLLSLKGFMTPQTDEVNLKLHFNFFIYSQCSIQSTDVKHMDWTSTCSFFCMKKILACLYLSH